MSLDMRLSDFSIQTPSSYGSESTAVSLSGPLGFYRAAGPASRAA